MVKKVNIEVNPMKQESIRKINSIMRVLAQELEPISISLNFYKFSIQNQLLTRSFKEKEFAINQKRYKLLSQYAKLALNSQELKVPTFSDFNDLFTPQKERYCRFLYLCFICPNLLIEDVISMTAKFILMQILLII